MIVRFEKAFLDSVKKHAAIKKQVEKKVRMIMEHPLTPGGASEGELARVLLLPRQAELHHHLPVLRGLSEERGRRLRRLLRL